MAHISKQQNNDDANQPPWQQQLTDYFLQAHEIVLSEIDLHELEQIIKKSFPFFLPGELFPDSTFNKLKNNDYGK